MRCRARIISIHAPHARSDLQEQSACLSSGRISIHAPHARSDALCQRLDWTAKDFNPRSSCEERLHCLFTYVVSKYNFNPRSSCEERREADVVGDASLYFNPRSSCEERLDLVLLRLTHANISIHAPHARSDETRINIFEPEFRFQSTLLMRGATGSRCRAAHHQVDFNPRSSCEERPQDLYTHNTAKLQFQSTLLMRGATAARQKRQCSPAYFNPRSSCEERLATLP